ncbi:hypothetical protein C0991_000653 [Blastosporella zonata]|nr:hypothetical protein C0991_000653 [Blastosporella zonata]
MIPLCHLTTLPLEILNHIALELSAVNPIGPPNQIVPVLLTCSTLNARLSPKFNQSLYGLIFEERLDFTAAGRRLGRPTGIQRAAWGWRAFDAMLLIRRGDVMCIGEEGLLLEALRMGVVLLLDDDGKNVRQMLLWARADVFVKRLVMQRTYERAEENQESIRSEPPAVRAHLNQLLLPYLYAPFRYPISPFPPNHYIIPPLLPSVNIGHTTVLTAHGPYPLYPPSYAAPFTFHGGQVINISPPLPALMARLSYIAREDLPMLAIAPHLDRTRADRHARGLYDVMPVRENMEEFDWGFDVYPPLGTGLRTREGAPKLLEGWNGVELVQDPFRFEEPYPSRPPAPRFPNFHIPPPVPRWVGKAPLYDREEKSRLWDMDFARMKACGDLDAGLSRKPFDGGVYELGSAEGLWVGRMLVSIAFAETPMHPPYGSLTTETLVGYPQFSYMRMRELHGVHGESYSPPLPAHVDTTVEDEEEEEEEEGDWELASDEEEQEEQEEEEEEPFALGPLASHDGMNNGWFAGRSRPILVHRSNDILHLNVPGVPGFGLYRRNTRFGGARWRNPTRQGNDAPPPPVLDSLDGPEEGYAHESTTCARCRDDRAFEEKWKSAMGEDVHALLDQGRVRGKCNGVKEIVVLGESDPAHGAAFHHYFLEGRIRPADGLFLGLRRAQDSNLGFGTILYWGYFVGKQTLVGNWRAGGTDPGSPAWEGSFAWGRRED